MRTASKVIPWTASAKNDGTPSCLDISSLPVITLAKKSAEGIAANGDSLANMATINPA